MAINGGFWDLDAEDRAATFEQAEREHGCSFHDLPASTRGYYYDKASGDRDHRDDGWDD